MNEKFNLTSHDYADLLGISTDNLRKRRRRGTETDFILDDLGNYWWHRDRPLQDKSNDVVPPDSRLKTRVKRRNRGALARGEISNYPNWKFEIRNKALALIKIKSGLKEDFSDIEMDEILTVAKQKVSDRNKKLSDDAFKSPLPVTGVPYGIDRTPLKYGSMLDGQGLKVQDERSTAQEYLKWKRKTDVKLIDKTGYKIPDFSAPHTVYKNRGYEMTSSDDTIEVKGVYEGVDYVSEKKFKNKVEESIWSLRNKK